MHKLLTDIRDCNNCEEFLPCKPRPIVQASKSSKIVIIGQAPGRKVQNSGIPWDDASGKNLREWLGVCKEIFYNPAIFAIIPMGLCYPGTGKSGDLPPRSECAPLWHTPLIDSMPDVELTLLIGQYAQKYYLKKEKKKNLTDTVKNYSNYLPQYFPLPHPSPRNNIWQKKNSWFKREVIEVLQATVQDILYKNDSKLA